MAVSPADRNGGTTSQYSSENSQQIPQQTRDIEKNRTDTSMKNSHEYPSGIARILILGPVTLTYFLFFLDLAVVSTAAPAITSQFNSLIDIGWYAFPRRNPSVGCFNGSCLWSN